MSSTWLLVVLVSLVTGNPLAAIGLGLLVLWAADAATLGLVPGPLRTIARWRRARRLRATLTVNPHDRRARLELADLVLARRPVEAAALVRSNVEAGDEDVRTAFLLGAALWRSGAHARAERAFAVARALEPGFRLGEIDLELGRLRLGRGDPPGAREALERLVAARPGTVEGRWLLSRALAAAGDAAGAARLRAEAWREFRALPRFRRRQERRFAWRMRPLYGAALGMGVVALIAAGALGVATAAIAYTPGPGGSCRARSGFDALALRRGGGPVRSCMLFRSTAPGEAPAWPEAEPPPFGEVAEVEARLEELFPGVSWGGAEGPAQAVGRLRSGADGLRLSLSWNARHAVWLLMMSEASQRDIERVCKRLGLVAGDMETMELYAPAAGRWMRPAQLAR